MIIVTVNVIAIRVTTCQFDTITGMIQQVVYKIFTGAIMQHNENGLNRTTDIMSGERPDDGGNYHAGIKIYDGIILMSQNMNCRPKIGAN